DVAWSGAGALTATVPAGLAIGGYDLTVTNPRGESGVLEQAYRVITSAESVASFRFDPLSQQRAGVPFAVGIAAVDSSGRVVDGFTGSVTLADSSGALTPTSAGPFVLGRAHLADAEVPQPRSQDVLTAADALGHLGSSNPFEVKPGLPSEIDFSSPALMLTAGACSPALTLEARDVRAVAVPLEEPEQLALLAGPPNRVSFFSDAACANALAALDWPAGQS